MTTIRSLAEEHDMHVDGLTRFLDLDPGTDQTAELDPDQEKWMREALAAGSKVVDEQGSLALQQLEEALALVENAKSSLEDAYYQRDEAIRAARAAGHSYKMLRAATGMSRTMLDRIIHTVRR